MTSLPLKTFIEPGQDKQVDLLFNGPRRRIVQITLRNGGKLERHTAAVPITIQCVTGSGTLTAGEKQVPLSMGVLVTLEPNVPHEITAGPAVSILLTQFTGS